MVITSPSKHLTFAYRDKTGTEIFSENIHPYDAEEYGKELNNIHSPIICYNTHVLDYVDVDKLYVITDSLDLVSFEQMYSEELEYLYPGEVIVNHACP